MLSEIALEVLHHASKETLYYLPTTKQYVMGGGCKPVTRTAGNMERERYIRRSGMYASLPKLAGTVGCPILTLTAAGWAAVRRQLTSEETRQLLGKVPSE